MQPLLRASARSGLTFAVVALLRSKATLNMDEAIVQAFDGDHPVIVRSLLRSKARADLMGPYIGTSTTNLEIVTDLLHHKARIDDTVLGNATCSTPLLLSLLQTKVRPSAQGGDAVLRKTIFRKLDSQDQTVRHRHVDTTEECVRMLVQRGMVSSNTHQLLIELIESEYFISHDYRQYRDKARVMQMLLYAKASPDGIPNGIVPLQLLCERASVCRNAENTLVAMLLNAKASPNPFPPIPNARMSPLHTAASKGNLDLVTQLLAAKAGVDGTVLHVDGTTSTPLCAAIVAPVAEVDIRAKGCGDKSHVAVIKCLLDARAGVQQVTTEIVAKVQQVKVRWCLQRVLSELNKLASSSSSSSSAQDNDAGSQHKRRRL